MGPIKKRKIIEKTRDERGCGGTFKVANTNQKEKRGSYLRNQEMKRGAGAGSEEWQEFCGLVKPLQSLSDIQWGAQAA